MLYVVIPGIMEDDANKIGFWLALRHSLAEFARFILKYPVQFLCNGASPHLWFVPSLMVSWMCIVALLVLGKQRLILPLTTACYIFVLLGATYRQAP